MSRLFALLFGQQKHRGLQSAARFPCSQSQEFDRLAWFLIDCDGAAELAIIIITLRMVMARKKELILAATVTIAIQDRATKLMESKAEHHGAAR